MSIQPTPLGDQFTRINQALQAQEKCAWVPAAIHNLIMAILARIFGRLDQMLQLWQAGALPAPPIRAIPNGTQAGDPTHRQYPPAMRAPRHRPHPATRPAEHRRARIATARSIPAPDRTQGAAPSSTIVPPARPRPARDPPAAQALFRGCAGMTIILRYHNNQPPTQASTSTPH